MKKPGDLPEEDEKSGLGQPTLKGEGLRKWAGSAGSVA